MFIRFDEVFMDVTSYLRTYGMNAHDLAMQMIRDVLQETGITATAGIGTNLVSVQDRHGYCGKENAGRCIGR